MSYNNTVSLKKPDPYDSFFFNTRTDGWTGQTDGRTNGEVENIMRLAILDWRRYHSKNDGIGALLMCV